MWPFRHESAQRAFSLIVALTGLILIAISINKSLTINIGNISLSYTIVGFVLFLGGLIYLVESTFK